MSKKTHFRNHFNITYVLLPNIVISHERRFYAQPFSLYALCTYRRHSSLSLCTPYRSYAQTSQFLCTCVHRDGSTLMYAVCTYIWQYPLHTDKSTLHLYVLHMYIATLFHVGTLYAHRPTTCSCTHCVLMDGQLTSNGAQCVHTRE